jgi:hypothetical protein
VKKLIRRNAKNKSLVAAMEFAKAYTDDNDNIVVYTDTAIAAETIKENKTTLLNCLELIDGIRHERLEVYVVQI